MSKIKLNNICIDVDINLTADDWQLYHIEGRDKAAADLNALMESKLFAGDLNNIYDILGDYSKFGAADSEGYDTVRRILRSINIELAMDAY